ncbi:MAG TPA: D-alanyl-D-alanine carboxypeptidase/D-alanyl-D-alanine-endopeptidase, partial [Actinomycetales bacterium]|nr:D-alanyl-D-alanine carboxypeptidase/D-alanyl-D-alanine-endopeptidase [Actinomycetales bacterium]
MWRVGLVLVVVLVLAAGLVTAALVTDVDGDPPGVEAAPAVRGPVPGL